jgi:hypothetical protein
MRGREETTGGIHQIQRNLDNGVTGSMLITSTIDALEGRDVTIVDVPGTFLTVDMDEEVIMCLQGKIVELMVKPAPEIYRKYVYIGPDNKPVLYVKLLKSLYGCLRSALLFYQKLLGDL